MATGIFRDLNVKMELIYSLLNITNIGAQNDKAISFY